MNKDESRPRTTKELLIRDSAERPGGAGGWALVSPLLFGRTPLPPRWLEPEQLAFVELDRASLVDPEIVTAAVELIGRIARLSDLVYEVLDDFLHRHEGIYDEARRTSFRRGAGPLLIYTALTDEYIGWPPAVISAPMHDVIDGILRQALEGERKPGTAVVPSSDPALNTALERQQGIGDNHVLRRIIVLDTTAAFLKTIPGAGLAVVYVALFLGLRNYAPDLTTHEDMAISGAAIASALGGSGVIVVGQQVIARLGRDRRTDAPKAEARRSDDGEQR